MKKLKLILYWDYDGEAGGERSKAGTKDAGINGYKGTERILKLLQDCGLRAVFSCVGVLGLPGGLPYHAPDQIREIAQSGHEVSCHGWAHEYIPGLRPNEFLEIVKKSKDVLEQAAQTEVTDFVPPWNTPYRYLGKFSLGLGQYRRGWRQHIDIPQMCSLLRQSGYRTIRIYYESLHLTIIKRLFGWKLVFRTSFPESINGITCIKVNTPGGFGPKTMEVLKSYFGHDGIVALWAHPHSLFSMNNQNEEHLQRILELLKENRTAFNNILPKDILSP
jgi:hypothetical protein